MVSILLADDHELVRFGVEKMLEAEQSYQIVATARTGEEAIEGAKQYRPDIVLMDHQMPGLGGLGATRRIVQTCPSTKVIGLSVYSDEPYPSQFLKAGASGYVTKGSSFDDIVKAIKTVLRGGCYISPEAAGNMALHSLGEKSSPFDSLSRRELEISLMLVNCEKVASISRVLNISTKTVNTYRYRIFEKLNVNSDVELAWLALRHGVVELPTTS
ncbi:response regulator [Litorivivens sp.]|uniref:response regulator n=1 Tax=Litorivivens sp. TaxID=2020868 RepID=UPI00356A8100